MLVTVVRCKITALYATYLCDDSLCHIYFKIGSVCLCHGPHAIGDHRYFLAPCDKHKHTGHAQRQPASQASTDSAWRHLVWLPHSSLGFDTPCRLSRHKFATIARSAIIYTTLFAI